MDQTSCLGAKKNVLLQERIVQRKGAAKIKESNVTKKPTSGLDARKNVCQAQILWIAIMTLGTVLKLGCEPLDLAQKGKPVVG